MAISIQSKDQAVGRPEVVEESEVEEEVVEAAGGGRIGLSEGIDTSTLKIVVPGSNESANIYEIIGKDNSQEDVDYTFTESVEPPEDYYQIALILYF